MSTRKITAGDADREPDFIEFVFDEVEFASSGCVPSDASPAVIDETPPADDLCADESRSPAFDKLSKPRLPRLDPENRARLSMQTPNRLFFYWSTAPNPFRTLAAALRDRAEDYLLVLKLADLKRHTEEIHPVEREGSWWFEVEADGEYRAEVGFYSPSRPYVRIMHSNVVRTPRKTPSARAAEQAEWRVGSDRFAKVLDAAGFKRDAFDVAIAGDDADASGAATREAFARLIGSDSTHDEILAEEIRHALLALAAGAALESLKYRVGARLFALLQANFEKFGAAGALATVREHFGVEADEMVEEESFSAVYNSSRVNFPRTLRRRLERKFEPLSSHSFK